MHIYEGQYFHEVFEKSNVFIVFDTNIIYLKREKKEEYSDKVKEILLRKEEASISEAVRKL